MFLFFAYSSSLSFHNQFCHHNSHWRPRQNSHSHYYNSCNYSATITISFASYLFYSAYATSPYVTIVYNTNNGKYETKISSESTRLALILTPPPSRTKSSATPTPYLYHASTITSLPPQTTIISPQRAQ